MKIVTSLYGDKYVSLLLVFLESIYQNSNTNSYGIYIFWSDVDERLLGPLKKTYKKATFIELESVKKIDSSSTGNYFSSLKSGKMAYLNKVYEFLEEDEEFLLIDCDTIILEDISDVFKEDFNIAFTSLPADISSYPVNIGVMFFKNNEATRRVTRNMQEHISAIVENEEFHNESFAKYGAADQAALCRIINFRSDNKIKDSLPVPNLKTLELDWFKYNNFSSTESFNNISVLHLKGSWQTIIFRGRALQSISNKRSKAIKVYLQYFNLFSKGISRVYSDDEIKEFGAKLGVKIPFFLHSQNDRIILSEWKYRLFQYPERFYRYFFNKKLTLLSQLFDKILFKVPQRIHKQNRQ